MSRPAVLPELYTGEKSWDEWIHHFESVATVNEWDGAAKLNWLCVRLTGRAGTVFRRLPDDTRGDYELAKKALKERFEPGVFIQRNGTMEWNGGMERWNGIVE